jgi:hypothetical protein
MGKGQRSHAAWDRRGKTGSWEEELFFFIIIITEISTYSVTLDGWSVALPMAEMERIDDYVTFTTGRWCT